MSTKGFDKKQIPIAIGSVFVVFAIMICIIVFGKTTGKTDPETTTNNYRVRLCTENVHELFDY